jgi:hypothetical protein
MIAAVSRHRNCVVKQVLARDALHLLLVCVITKGCMITKICLLSGQQALKGHVQTSFLCTVLLHCELEQNP